MMGKKKLSEFKAQLAAPSPTKTPKGGAKQLVEELEALFTELERVAEKPCKAKSRRPVKR